MIPEGRWGAVAVAVWVVAAEGLLGTLMTIQGALRYGGPGAGIRLPFVLLVVAPLPVELPLAGLVLGLVTLLRPRLLLPCALVVATSLATVDTLLWFYGLIDWLFENGWLTVF